ncbi:MAG: zinc-ribbon domain-containing protein [Oscillospiraceae bacterium]|nr:zinc-ribbon domain-containing protein [Oscillospiraceae bacterium]
MFCEKCGRELEENAKFCDKCGVPVAQDILLPSSEDEETASRSHKAVLMIVAAIAGGLAGILIVPYLIGVLSTQNRPLKDDTDISMEETTNYQYQNKMTETVSNPDERAKLQKKNQSKSSSKDIEPTAQHLDTVEDCYLVNFLGKSVGEVMEVLGEPYKAIRGYLGGGGNDTGYEYAKGDIVFITLFFSEEDFYFDDRDAIVNYIYMYRGNVDEYVRIGMSYNQINEFYSLSDYSYSELEDNYTATAEFAHNGCNCVLLLKSYDGNKTTSVNEMILIAKDVYN